MEHDDFWRNRGGKVDISSVTDYKCDQFKHIGLQFCFDYIYISYLMQSWKKRGNKLSRGIKIRWWSTGHLCGGRGVWSGVARQAQHEQGQGLTKGELRGKVWGWKAKCSDGKNLRRIYLRASGCWQCTYHSFGIRCFWGDEGSWNDSGWGVRYMHLVYAATQLEVGEVSGGGRGRQRKRWHATRGGEKSHNRLPAEDDFQLAAVELPSVGQAHDALLVARQVLQVHLLKDKRRSQNTYE